MHFCCSWMRIIIESVTVEGKNEKITLNSSRMCTKSQCQSGDPKDLGTKSRRWCGSFIIPVVICFYCSNFCLSPSLAPTLSISTCDAISEPLNQVTSHSCLCPWEEGVMLTVRTHCSTGEEEEMKRLEVALTARPRIDGEIKGEMQKDGEVWMRKCLSEPVCQLQVSMISGRCFPGDTCWSRLCCFRSVG